MPDTRPAILEIERAKTSANKLAFEIGKTIRKNREHVNIVPAVGIAAEELRRAIWQGYNSQMKQES